MGDLLSLGVMGIRGSFSEEAAIEYARDNNLGEVEIVELLNTEKVLRAWRPARSTSAYSPWRIPTAGSSTKACTPWPPTVSGSWTCSR